MLSLAFVTATGGRYYTGLAREDYYVSGGESPGTWHDNKAARAFGVRGKVEKEQLEKLFDGYHPESGKELAQNHGKADRRSSVDMCFSAPKDVSTLYAVSGEAERHRIEEAFHRAVDQTLDYLNGEFGFTRRGQGGYDLEHVDLLIAKFDHRQSRGQQPQVHAHCLILNAAQRSDGSWGSIDASPFLHNKKMLGAYFRSSLASELGIPLEQDQKTKFSFRIPGVPQSLSERWSSRAREIEAEARARGVEGGKSKALIALETRRAKDERPLAEVKQEWRETARQHGFTEQSVTQILRQPRHELTPDQATRVVDAAIEKAVKDALEQQAHFKRGDLLRDVCVATVTHGIAPQLIRERVEAALGQDRFVRLGVQNYQEYFTTKQVLEQVEGRALETAERLGQQTSRTVQDRFIARAMAREPRELNPGQKEAVTKICQGPDLTLIEGPPGSGKSTLFGVVRRAIEAEGGNVIGLAPSNRAARELEKSSGIKSYTIDRFLFDRERTTGDTAKHHAKMLVLAALHLPTWKLPKLHVDRRTTLIVDECAMVGNDKLSRALQHAEKIGCRVVLVGDRRQLPAVEQGGLFRELCERAGDGQKVALTEIVRQREAWAREAIHKVGRGEAAEALKMFAEHGQLHVAPTPAETQLRLIERWKQHGIRNPGDHLILAATNAEVAELNRAAQAARREAGRLGYRWVKVGDETIREGDRILFTDTNKRFGLVKSEFATVEHIELLSRRMTVLIDGQKEAVTFSLGKFKAFRLGYAATAHRAQGMTLDQNAYVLVGRTMQNREMSYVQISRAKGETHLFCDEKTAGREHVELERLIQRSEEKLSAHTIARDRHRDDTQQREDQKRLEAQREEERRQERLREEEQQRQQHSQSLSL